MPSFILLRLLELFVKLSLTEICSLSLITKKYRFKVKQTSIRRGQSKQYRVADKSGLSGKILKVLKKVLYKNFRGFQCVPTKQK